MPSTPPWIARDVRGRLRVEAAQPHGRDRAGGGQDRAAPVLGADPRVRRAAVEVGLEAVVRRRGDDDLADRAGVVVDVAERRAQARDVEGLRAGERVLLADGEEQLDADRQTLDRRRGGRAPAGRRPPPCCRRRGSCRRRSPSRRRRGPARSGRRAGRCPGARTAGRGARPSAPGMRASRLPHSPPIASPAPSSSTSSPSPRSSAGHVVGDGPLAPRRAGDRAQRGERLVEPPALDLRGGPH